MRTEAIAWYQVQDCLVTWAPIIFMGLLVYFIWKTMKLMSRTKPQQIEPESDVSISWEDVAGADEAKAELREVVDFLRDPDRFHKLGATVPKGILLHGPPGTGKTRLAQAVANESDATFFTINGPEIMGSAYGESEKRLREVFDEAA